MPNDPARPLAPLFLPGRKKGEVHQLPRHPNEDDLASLAKDLRRHLARQRQSQVLQKARRPSPGKSGKVGSQP